MKKIVAIALSILALGLVSCKKTKVEINGIADLEGKKIGVQAGTTGEIWSQESSNAKAVSSYVSGIDAALDLKAGRIDAVVIDELPAKEIVSRNPDLIVVRDSYFAENKEEYAIAVKKGNTEILNNINATINEMRNSGDYEMLLKAFMPADGKIQIPSHLEYSASGKIKLGTNAAFPPFEYTSGTEYVGFDITMGEYIARTCKKNLEVVDMKFDSLIPALSSGVVDFVAAGMSVTEERKKNVDFSVPYFASEQVIIVRK